MIYLIDGNEPALIENKIKDLTKNCESIYRFNGQDSSFDILDVLNACDSSSLFNDKNIILLSNPSFLLKKESKNEELINKFLNYINNPRYETDLIIYTLDDVFNKTLKTYKTIRKNAEVISYTQIDQYNFKSTARLIINNYNLNITNEAIDRLITISNNSQTALLNNIEILKIYPDRIDINVIQKLCITEINEDIFALINAISKNDITSTKRVLNSLYEHNNSVFMIVSVLASQLRFMYQVSYYSSNGYSSNDIASITNSKPYRIQKTLEKLGSLDCNRILMLLSELSNIDILNKSDSSLSQEDRFELYLIKNFRRQK